MPIKVGTRGLRVRLMDVPPNIVKSAIPEITGHLVVAAKELAPKRTGKMARKIEGEVSFGGTKNITGRVIPRGPVAHLVHDPVRAHDIGEGAFGPVWMGHRKKNWLPDPNRKYLMRYRINGHWYSSHFVRIPGRIGRPFLQWALTFTREDVERIIAKHGEAALRATNGAE